MSVPRYRRNDAAPAPVAVAKPNGMRVHLTTRDDGDVLAEVKGRGAAVWARDDQSIAGSRWEVPLDSNEYAYTLISNDPGLVTTLQRNGYSLNLSDYSPPSGFQANAVHRKYAKNTCEQPSDNASPIWRKRQIVLSPELVVELSRHHGGQFTALYALASSGAADLVSLSQIDAALAELPKRSDVYDELSLFRADWRENTAKRCGMDLDDADYEYDETDYGLTEDEEAAVTN